MSLISNYIIMKRIIAILVLATLAFTVVVAIFESAVSYATSDALYTLAGFAMFVFGIWGSVLLLRSK